MCTPASITCSKVLNTIKTSQLDFYLQETPYSAFITIRKKYVKSFKSDTVNVETENGIEELKRENENLRNCVREKTAELETYQDTVLVLEEKLEKAEKDMLKHFDNSKIQKSKHSDEVNLLKSIKQKDNDTISVLTSNLSRNKTEIKSLHKEVYNLEKKNETLKNKVDSFIASKRETINEKEKLANEVKNLKKKIKNVEQENKRIDTNNNNSHNTSSSVSRFFSDASSQTNKTSSDKFSSKAIKCLVCGKLCNDVYDLKNHSEADHKLSINFDKLNDENEEDSTSRFINSLEVDPIYLEERRSCIPKHWDHIDERIKIRLIAKMNFEDKSTRISRNMKNVDFTNNHYKGISFETSML